MLSSLFQLIGRLNKNSCPPHQPQRRRPTPFFSGWAGCLKPVQEINLSEKTTLLTRFQSTGLGGPSAPSFAPADNLLLYRENLAEALCLYRPAASPNNWAGPPGQARAGSLPWAPSLCCSQVPREVVAHMPGHWGKDGGGSPWLPGHRQGLGGMEWLYFASGDQASGPSLWGLTNQGGL